MREERLKPYHQDLVDLIPRFNKVTFTHVPRFGNKFADAGPYVIKTILSGGAARLIDLDGNEFSTLVNLDQLKRYYP